MKYAFVAMAAVLVLTGAGCFSRDSDSISDGARPGAVTEEQSAELQALILQNTNLVLEAGRAGIDAPRTRDWSQRAGRISLSTSVGDWEGAIQDMRILNAEIQAAIDAAE